MSRRKHESLRRRSRVELVDHSLFLFGRDRGRRLFHLNADRTLRQRARPGIVARRLLDRFSIDRCVRDLPDRRSAPAGALLAHVVSLGGRKGSFSGRLAVFRPIVVLDVACPGAEVLVADVGWLLGVKFVWPFLLSVVLGSNLAPA